MPGSSRHPLGRRRVSLRYAAPPSYPVMPDVFRHPMSRNGFSLWRVGPRHKAGVTMGFEPASGTHRAAWLASANTPSQHQVKQPPAVSARPGDERPACSLPHAGGEHLPQRHRCHPL